ncbi:MAG: two-component regulator propeller domain-containing protein [Pseudomonadota bacterium]
MNATSKWMRTTGSAALLALTGWLSAAPACAGQPMRFDVISMSDGLSQSTINSVYQDSTGFLWIATQSGLNRYDGYEFHHYKRELGNDRALADDFIWEITEGDNGDLWLATKDGGVARWNAATDDFTVFRHDPDKPDSLADDGTRTILGTSDGWIWVGTHHDGLDRIDPSTGRVEHFRHDPEDSTTIASNEVFALLRDTRGALWVGTNDGLSRYDPIAGRFTTFRHDPADPGSISHNQIRSLFEDQSGALWVGTRRGGVNLFDRRSGTFTRFMHDPKDARSISNNNVRSILQDDAGRLWIGTGKGLNLFDVRAQNFHRYLSDRANPGSLSHSYVMKLFQDDSGVLWVGTRSGGLNKWNPRSWGFGHHSPDQLSDGNVTSFAEDADENIWVGTFGGGVNRINRRTSEVAHFGKATGSKLSDDRIMTLLIDRSDNLWLGTVTGGLNRMNLDSGEIDHFLHDSNDEATISANGIMALFEDRGGNLWIGTYGGGVNRLFTRTGEVQRFPFGTGNGDVLSSPHATAFVEDRWGNIWIGTDGGGLNLLNPASGRFHHFRPDRGNPTSLGADTVYALHLDIRGTIWVGTQGGGLQQVIGDSRDPESVRFKSFKSGPDGLANGVVYGIKSDTQSDLWLSTNYGIIHFVPGTGEVRNFHRSHGLQDEEFNFGAHFRSSRGELFFGGANGFNAFYPSDLEINDNAPPVILTSVALLNQRIETDNPHWLVSGLDISHEDDVVSFSFSALDFTSPAENRYLYQLEGFDPDWVNAGSLRHVTYTNLDGGNYVFRVKAANSDGVWGKEGVAIPIAVEPPPWLTWWAYVLYAAALMTVIAGVWRAQQVKLLREAEYSRRLEQDVQTRTKELAERNDDLRVLNQRFLEASLTDPLTGLRNRRYVFEEASKDIEVVRRRYRDGVPDGDADDGPWDVAFLMIDLDNFKPVNDTCGHEAGDKLLLQVRDVLLGACRQSDTVIRWGGDEFMVIGRYATREQGEELAERIRSRMANTVFSIGNGQVARTTCSIGFATFPFVRSQPEHLEWEQVLNLADAAMYRAKQQRNAWVSFVSTELSATIDNPFYTIRDQADALVEQGLIEIHTSQLADSEVAIA